MATHRPTPARRSIDYPTGDGRPLAETDIHRDDLIDLVKALQAHYAHDPRVYVSGNLLVFYEQGNRRKHVSPDVFVVKDVPRHRRLNYLIWEEGKAPDFVIELTSRTTKKEDIEKKYALYRDVLRVPEYILFDPLGHYLKPPLQGYRLVGGRYELIPPVAGRIPSEVLGLHLERDGQELRLYDPATGRWLPTPQESIEQAEAARQQAEAALRQSEAARQQAVAAQQDQAAEIERLRRELEALREGRNGGA
jgi:Uma2 family endonuclease